MLLLLLLLLLFVACIWPQPQSLTSCCSGPMLLNSGLIFARSKPAGVEQVRRVQADNASQYNYNVMLRYKRRPWALIFRQPSSCAHIPARGIIKAAAQLQIYHDPPSA
jgi:hypothetical protein